MCNILKRSQKYNPCENEIIALLTTHYLATLCFSVDAGRGIQANL